MRIPRRLSPRLVSLGWLALVLPTGGAARTPQPSPLKPAETFVIAQVNAGEIADLEKQFPQESERTIGAAFLVQLVTGKLSAAIPGTAGVRINGAIFTEPVTLAEEQIACELWLDHCRFPARVDLGNALFNRDLSFEGSSFAAAVNFSGVKAMRSLFVNGARFAQGANFSGCEITRNLEASGAQFKSRDAPVFFNTARIGGSAFFHGTVFAGPVNLSEAEIAGNLEAQEAQFSNEKAGAILNSIHVRHAAFFRQAVFRGPVDLGAAEITYNLEAQGAKFNGAGQRVTLNSAKVGHDAFFSDAHFAGPVNLVGAEIGGNFQASKATFGDPGEALNCNSLRVGHSIFLKQAIFAGAVNFGSAEVKSDFAAEGAQFNNPQATIWLTMRCQERAFLTDAHFAGPVSFADSSFLDLSLGGDKGLVPALTLSRSTIRRELRLRNMKVNELVASSLHVEGAADLTNLAVKDSADFTDAAFATLDLSGSDWPQEPAHFLLQGMSYRYLKAAPNESASHRRLLDLIGRADYAADVYRNLGDFFSRQGFETDADRAFIAGKRRERAEFLHPFSWGNSLRWLGSWFLDQLVGYGRRPWKASLPCAVIVLLGCFLFRLQRMEAQEPKYRPADYNPFWYSLSSFVPFVDLQVTEGWKPRPAFLKHYLRVHILLGWILIPIVVAALTGLLE